MSMVSPRDDRYTPAGHTAGKGALPRVIKTVDLRMASNNPLSSIPQVSLAEYHYDLPDDRIADHPLA